MIQKSAKRRGRPREYDPSVALARAMDVFWVKGYAATSLDDLSEATGMNRPSLYAAFGDKESIYRRALENYEANSRNQIAAVLAEERPLRDALREFYTRALQVYLSGKEARGCFVIGTALTEAAENSEIRTHLASGQRSLEDALRVRIAYAKSRGEIAPDRDPDTLAKLATGTLYYLAIRSRIGEPRKALESAIEAGLDSICGPARKSR